MADPADGTWLQIAFGGVTALATGVAGHLYTLVGSRSKSAHVRMDKIDARIDAEFVRKDVMATALAGLAQSQNLAREDYRILAEKMDDVARDVNIIAGRLQAGVTRGGQHDDRT